MRLAYGDALETSSLSSYLFIYQVTSYHKKKLQLPVGLSPKHRNMQFLKTNTQTCRVKAIFSPLVRRQRGTERSSKSTATLPS